MQFAPELANSGSAGRDARLFPGSHLDYFTLEDILVPVQRGTMVGEGSLLSYWSVIPQFGRVWRDDRDADGWTERPFR